MTKLRALTLLAALTSLLLVPSAFGPATGQVLPAPPPLSMSSNVSLIGNVPGSFFGMNFKGNHGYATGSTGLTVFDVSQPANPVIVGGLPLPHFENEDVDICGNTLVIASDAINPAAPLYVIDITDPSLPTLSATFPLGFEGTGNGAGHIANFVTSDCSLLWVDGGSRVEVVDVSDPTAPQSLGDFESAASKSDAFTVTHDTELDSQGVAWSTGGGGAAGYKPTSDPLKPQLVAKTDPIASNPSPLNDFILHNSQRRGNTLLVTEEDYVDTDEEQPGSCNGQGKFETYKIDTARKRVINLDTWETELNGLLSAGRTSKAPLTVNCSSHWFDEQGGIAAVGWYEQGTRFLDTSDPKKIRQVGYYLPANGSTWAAYWAPKDTSGTIVYTADAYRGLDVLKITQGGKNATTQTAPIPDEWYGDEIVGSDGYLPSQKFGYLCPVFKGL